MAQDYTITKRPLTDQEIDLIYHELKSTPNITGYTRSEWKAFKNVFVATRQGILIGISLTKMIDEQWDELAVLYVLPAFRHKGVGKHLFYKAFESLKDKKKNIYAVSRNQSIIALLKSNRFELLNFLKLPPELKLHILKFALSPYRIYEFVRKSLVYKSKDKWIYCIKLNNNHHLQ